MNLFSGFMIIGAAIATRLAGGGADGVVHVWDVESGRELYGLEAHDGTVSAVQFLPDGRRFLTAGVMTKLAPLTWPPESNERPVRANGTARVDVAARLRGMWT